jgi:hypothetical protein
MLFLRRLWMYYLYCDKFLSCFREGFCHSHIFCSFMSSFFLGLNWKLTFQLWVKSGIKNLTYLLNPDAGSIVSLQASPGSHKRWLNLRSVCLAAWCNKRGNWEVILILRRRSLLATKIEEYGGGAGQLQLQGKCQLRTVGSNRLMLQGSSLW